MSEKKNFTENQILDLGKISPVEKWWISHSILVALEKDLKGKDIKDIENFYKNNISLDAQKAILKISMEVEKNQIPENRKKKWNYKIVYKTDNIDLGKLKKIEEKPKEEVKVENPKVESTETIDNSKTEITPTSTFEQNIATPVVEEKVDETPTIIIEEAKNPTPEAENIPAPMADPIKTEENLDIIPLDDKEAEKIILNFLNNKKIDLDWIDFLWMKWESKSRENFTKKLIENLKDNHWWKILFNEEQLNFILDKFIQSEENINKGEEDIKINNVSSYIDESFGNKNIILSKKYKNYIELELAKAKETSDKNSLDNIRKRIEFSIKSLNSTLESAKEANKTQNEINTISNYINLANKDLEEFNKIYSSKIKTNVKSKKWENSLTQKTENKTPAENNSAKPVQANENKPKAPTPEERADAEARKWENSNSQNVEKPTSNPLENKPTKPVQNSENKPKAETETKKLENSNEQEILNNFMLVIGNENLDLDFIWIWNSEQKSREDFAKEFVKYVIEKEWNFSYNQIQINYFMKKAFKQEENIDYGYLFSAEKKKIILDIVYNALQKSKEENFWEQVTPPTNPNQKNRQVAELSPMQ